MIGYIHNIKTLSCSHLSKNATVHVALMRRQVSRLPTPSPAMGILQYDGKGDWYHRRGSRSDIHVIYCWPEGADAASPSSTRLSYISLINKRRVRQPFSVQGYPRTDIRSLYNPERIDRRVFFSLCYHLREPGHGNHSLSVQPWVLLFMLGQIPRGQNLFFFWV